MEKEVFQQEMRRKTQEIDALLTTCLPKEEGYQKTVLQAMNYSVLAGGKRLRPMLMLEVYRMFGGQGGLVEPFMAAIEMIHTYSLVHDDLPAMDDDEYRRGRKTTHVVYGEAFAILAGDGLLNYAFETALRAFELPQAGEEGAWRRVARALSVLAQKAGVYGMIGGQTADIEAEGGKDLTKQRLLFIHEKKTAALIQASMMVGALLAGADEQEVAQIEKCAYNIGIAFQIQDDILDVVGTKEELGKPIGSDEKNHKQTYVTLNGLERSRQEVARLSEEAVAILDGLSERKGAEDAAFLRQLVLQLIDRRS